MDKREEFVGKFTDLYNKFKKNFYKYIFKTFEEDSKSNITPLEVFTLEVIYLLEDPTVSELTDFLGTSKPNTAYRVNKLVEKGYVVRQQSQEDGREFHLVLTPKFFRHHEGKNKETIESVELVMSELDDDQMAILSEAIDRMNELVFKEKND